MIVNLYVDHLASVPPQSAEDVLYDTRQHARVYREAAKKIGLTPKQYAEFQKHLLDGDAVYVHLPKKFTSMAGNHRGSVYAIRNAVTPTSVMGWKVRLSDGNVVYVPQTCGNLSLVAAPPAHAVAYVAPPVSHPVLVTVAPSAPVAAEPVYPGPDFGSAPVAAAPAAVAAPSHNDTGFFLVPVIGGIIYGVTHIGSGGGTTVPPCSGGSNAQFACAK